VQSHHVTSQLRVDERGISSTLEHFDAARQLLAVYGWSAPMTDESSGGYLSLTEIHALREAVRMLRQDYLQMVADRDHLVEWGSTAYEALLDREEVSELTHELTATTEALEDTQRNLQESQIQLEEVTVELEHLRSTPAPDPVRLHIEVVGGEFAPTVGIEEHDVGADTHVQDLGALGTDEVGVPVESSSQVDLSHIADSVVQLAVPHFQRDHLWIAGEYVEASTYNFYCTKSFMEYLLVSADVHQDSYGVSEGILIRGSCAIRRLVGKIVETLSTMLPHRDFEVGFVERIAQGPTQPTATRSQRLEPSSDSQFGNGEPVTEIGVSDRHFTVGYAHHFSFDPQVGDLISRRGKLAPISYHPLWDGLAPSFADGFGSCKLDYLQCPHTQDCLSGDRVDNSDPGTFGHCCFPSTVGCEYWIDRDSDFDRVVIADGLSSVGLFSVSASTVGLQLLFPVVCVWLMSVLSPQEFSADRDITCDHPWDPGGL
jgi:hypothetical protein